MVLRWDSFFSPQKRKKNRFLSEIRIQRSEKEEWHLFHFIYFFFNLPPVALLTLEGSPVNKPLRAVYIQSDISAEGADSSFSLLGVKGKNK